MSRPLTLPPLPGFDPARYARQYPMMQAVERRGRPAPTTAVVLRPCQFCGAESPFGSRVRGQPACSAHQREVREYRTMMWLAESDPAQFAERYAIPRAHEQALAEDERRELDRIAQAYYARQEARHAE